MEIQYNNNINRKKWLQRNYLNNNVLFILLKRWRKWLKKRWQSGDM